MRIIDMHLNPLVEPHMDLVTRVSLQDLRSACDHFRKQFPAASIERGVMVVLDQNFLAQEECRKALPPLLADTKFVLSYALDFRSRSALEQLEQARALGIPLLKFHPYLQKIESTDFRQCILLARHAESLGMLVMVCCSYGTLALDQYSGLRLATALSEQVTCPIVMSHAGGAQILDAMLAAVDSKNLFLDTSFSLPYYIGSSIETDFAFAMKKLGSHRWVYGSDAPFVGLQESLETTLSFFDRHRFSHNDIDHICYETAATLLG